jgi:Ca2+/Na+ antiporter
MLAASLLMWPFLFRAVPIDRLVGAGLLALYAAYVWVLL